MSQSAADLTDAGLALRVNTCLDALEAWARHKGYRLGEALGLPDGRMPAKIQGTRNRLLSAVCEQLTRWQEISRVTAPVGTFDFAQHLRDVYKSTDTDVPVFRGYATNWTSPS